MARHTIRIGLNLPILGEPEQRIHAARPVTQIALLAADYHGLDPAVLVSAGDRVRRGQPIFEDKKTPGVIHTAPGAGTIAAIHRADPRGLHSIVIDLSESERADAPAQQELQTFSKYSGAFSEVAISAEPSTSK